MLEYIKTWFLSLDITGLSERDRKNHELIIDQLEKHNQELLKEKHAWMRLHNKQYFGDK